jgi:hypothetical protein
MLSFPVYRERHPCRPFSHRCLTSIPFCFSPPSNLQTLQRANALSASRMQVRDDHSSNTLEIFPPETAILSHVRPEQRRVSLLAATPTDLPSSAASKRLTENLTPLDATLTKNRGEGHSQRFNVSTFKRSNGVSALCSLFAHSLRSLDKECFTTLLHSSSSALFLKKGGCMGVPTSNS